MSLFRVAAHPRDGVSFQNSFARIAIAAALSITALSGSLAPTTQQQDDVWVAPSTQYTVEEDYWYQVLLRSGSAELRRI